MLDLLPSLPRNAWAFCKSSAPGPLITKEKRAFRSQHEKGIPGSVLGLPHARGGLGF